MWGMDVTSSCEEPIVFDVRGGSSAEKSLTCTHVAESFVKSEFRPSAIAIVRSYGSWRVEVEKIAARRDWHIPGRVLEVLVFYGCLSWYKQCWPLFFTFFAASTALDSPLLRLAPS